MAGKEMTAIFKNQCSALKKFFERQSAQVNEPEWLEPLRSAKFRAFLEQGDLAPFSDADILDFKLSLQKKKNAFPGKIVKELASGYSFRGEAYTLAFVDGRYAPEIFPQNHLPAGVIFTNIISALTDHPSLVIPYLKREYSEENLTSSANLNLALMMDGVFLYVSDNAELDRPFHLFFITSSGGATNFRNLNNLIIAGKSSKFVLFEEHTNFGEANCLNNIYTQICLADAAKVTYHKLNNDAKNNIHLGNLHVDQKKQSYFSGFHLQFGSFFAEDNIAIDLRGKGAECDLEGLSLLNNNQRYSHQVLINHFVPQTKSNELYKSVISDMAFGAFCGRIKVFKKAQKSTALLKNQNLLLSKNATIKTQPELEIYADDVKCNHGATIGRLDQKALFYLRSRGIEENEAKTMLIGAFAQDVIDGISSPLIKEYCRLQLNSKSHL